MMIFLLCDGCSTSRAEAPGPATLTNHSLTGNVFDHRPSVPSSEEGAEACALTLRLQEATVSRPY